jgi:hypothetical protein
VIQNLTIQKKAQVVSEQKPHYNLALLRIGIGVALVVVSAIVFPDRIYIPFGLIAGGIIYALIAKSKMTNSGG